MQILHIDEHYVAVAKPAGLLVHRSAIAGGRSEEALVQRLRDQIGAWVYPVHRLDRPTSGVIVLGRSSEAARRLSCVFVEHEVDKRYLAVVRGYAPERAEIDAPVRDGETADSPCEAPAPSFGGTRRSSSPSPSVDIRAPATRCSSCGRTPADGASSAAIVRTSATRSSATPPTAKAATTASSASNSPARASSCAARLRFIHRSPALC